MMMNSKKQNANVNQNTWLCDKLLEQTESKKKINKVISYQIYLREKEP